MSEDERWESYFIKGTDVLKNNLGIKNKELLYQKEVDITFEKLVELYENPIEGNFDAEHLKNIHLFLFGDIYPFAGTFRNVDMTKPGSHYFVTNSEISKKLDIVLKEMHEEFSEIPNNILKHQRYVQYLAEYYYDILTVHPFREGNGRTIREFLREFVLKFMPEYVLEWSRMDEKELNEAMKYAYIGKSKLEYQFAKALVLETELEKENMGR